MEEAVVFVKLVLGGIFLSSAIEKVNTWDNHLAVVKEYRILPRRLAKHFVKAEVMLEIAAGALLVLGILQAVAGWLAVMLLTIYSTAVAINLLRGRSEISCGCGGVAGDHRISWSLVLRNAGLILIGGGIAVIEPGTLGSVQHLVSGAAEFGLSYWMTLFAAVCTLLFWTFGSEYAAAKKHMAMLTDQMEEA